MGSRRPRRWSCSPGSGPKKTSFPTSRTPSSAGGGGGPARQGGRTAEAGGGRLRLFARHAQVLCVTQVPQVAAWASRHFRAEKSERLGRTVAAVRELTGAERVAEIARMLAGEKVPETAIKHARALLDAGAE